MQEKWEKIINLIGDKSIEIKTYPKINKEALWFSVSTDRNNIYIDIAKENLPSVKIKKRSPLTIHEFKEIYPIYLKREKGESVSKEAREITYNSVYYYGIIKYILEK